MTLGIETLIYVALCFGILGFLARDQLVLRLLMLGSTVNYILYYALVGATPLWDPIYANFALGAANLLMIFVIAAERTSFTMSTDDLAFYRRFPLMTPGQFRRLMRAGCHSIGPRPLVREGTRVDTLYFVKDGTATVEKDGQRFVIGPDVFVGEVAFITGGTASATVTLSAGATALGWSHEALARLFRRMPSLQAALLAHLNMDMARKVARSGPPAPVPAAPPPRGHGPTHLPE